MIRRSKIRKALPSAKLTPRQLEVALMIADGLTNTEIADRLDVSTKTVEFHRTSVYRTAEVKSTALLVRYLIREGLLEP